MAEANKMDKELSIKILKNFENEIPTDVLLSAINYYQNRMGMKCKNKNWKTCKGCPFCMNNNVGECLLLSVQLTAIEYNAKIIKGV